MIQRGMGRNGSFGRVYEEAMSPEDECGGRRAIEIIVGVIAILIGFGVFSSL